MNAKHNIQINSELSPTKTRTLLLVETTSKTDNTLASKLASKDVTLIATLESATDLVSNVESQKPDMLILSVDALDSTVLDQLTRINETSPLPITVFAKQHRDEILKTFIPAGITSYNVDDVQDQHLSMILDLSAARFEQTNRLSNELKQTHEKLKNRKLIERAKGILMQQNNLSEDDAYAQMRKSAMNQGQSIAELAKKIISVFDILEKA